MVPKLVTQAGKQARCWLRVLAAMMALNAIALPQGQSRAIGNWSGRFSSHNFASFPVSIAITQDANGHLHGEANMAHPCVKAGKLIVTIVNNSIVLGGSDTDGDTITFRGTIDAAGTLLDLSFVLNGSPSARCETDQGNGSMEKH
jgi:hypothetical protein